MKIMSCSRRYVYQLIADGRLQGVRLGRGVRVLESSLVQFIKENMITPREKNPH